MPAAMNDQERARPLVVKIGGGELDDPAFLSALAAAVDSLRTSGQPVILVHGGGKTIAAYQEALGLEPRFLDGLRVTTEDSLAVAEMVLSGLLNKRIVRALTRAGVPAAGLSGVDGATLQVRKMQHPAGDLGQVGEIVKTDPALVQLLLEQGYTPVLSPISLGQDDGRNYNVNADHAAMAIGAGVEAPRLVFVTDVPGVQIAGRVVRAMTAEQANAWIEEGFIRGGMIPKVRSALQALDQGVAQAVIANLAGVQAGRGTRVVPTA